MSHIFLRAEELARLAGVHKSTVLLAIQRGELRASRTAGRSTRISPEDAGAYLRSRGCPVPPDLEPPILLEVAVVSESAEVVETVRGSMPRGAVLSGGDGLYARLVAIGASTPACVVVDLDVLFLNPIELLHVLRANRKLEGVPLLAVSRTDELFRAALSAGATVTLLLGDSKNLADVLVIQLASVVTRPQENEPSKGVRGRPRAVPGRVVPRLTP